MKVAICVFSLLCMPGLVSAQSGPPGGGSQGGGSGSGSGGGSGTGGGTTIPSFPGNFSAGPIPTMSLSDRVLAEWVPGDKMMPTQMSGSSPVGFPNPPMSVVPKASYDIKWQLLDRNSPTLVPMHGLNCLANILSGTGATGGWDGNDPGATILIDGTTAGGYASPSAGIMVGLTGQHVHGSEPYKYLYSAQYSSSTYEFSGTNGFYNLVVKTYSYSGESAVFWRPI